MKGTVKERVYKLISESLEKNKSSIHDDMRLKEDLDLEGNVYNGHSINKAELLYGLEDEFMIVKEDFFDKNKIATVGDLVDYFDVHENYKMGFA